MKWNIVTPPVFYCTFWAAFLIAATLLVYWLGPIVIARGIERYTQMQK